MVEKLEDIGFYTLSDKRAKESSFDTPLYRCELILTEACNFKCPYCRPINAKTLTLKEAKSIVDKWGEHKLKNIRLSGGEPTLWAHLAELVDYINAQPHIERIAISTNGSADSEIYQDLISRGVNDFSISLDSCCSSGCQKMTGISGEELFAKITKNISIIASSVYTTIGIVMTEDNVDSTNLTCYLADTLGVNDIRIIPSAQWNEQFIPQLGYRILKEHPILKYRYENAHKGRPFRGISETDSSMCRLCLDDMAVMNNMHYPCIIYLREGGKPIGSMDKPMTSIRSDRLNWCYKHNSKKDEICRKNCLDVCVDFNNKAYGFYDDES